MRRDGRQELESGELKAFLSADMAFHMLILRASGNGRILRAVTETRAVSSIFRMRRQRHDLPIVEQAHAQHASILDALRAGESAKAQLLMGQHIAASNAQTLAQFDADWSGPVRELPVDLPLDIVLELERIEKAHPSTPPAPHTPLREKK